MILHSTEPLDIEQFQGDFAEFQRVFNAMSRICICDSNRVRIGRVQRIDTETMDIDVVMQMSGTVLMDGDKPVIAHMRVENAMIFAWDEHALPGAPCYQVDKNLRPVVPAVIQVGL
jgi:hypothetical protein